jgi:hypothetical protein
MGQCGGARRGCGVTLLEHDIDAKIRPRLVLSIVANERGAQPFASFAFAFFAKALV